MGLAKLVETTHVHRPWSETLRRWPAPLCTSVTWLRQQRGRHGSAQAAFAKERARVRLTSADNATVTTKRMLSARWRQPDTNVGWVVNPSSGFSVLYAGHHPVNTTTTIVVLVGVPLSRRGAAVAVAARALQPRQLQQVIITAVKRIRTALFMGHCERRALKVLLLLLLLLTWAVAVGWAVRADVVAAAALHNQVRPEGGQFHRVGPADRVRRDQRRVAVPAWCHSREVQHRRRGWSAAAVVRMGQLRPRSGKDVVNTSITAVAVVVVVERRAEVTIWYRRHCLRVRVKGVVVVATTAILELVITTSIELAQGVVRGVSRLCGHLAQGPH